LREVLRGFASGVSLACTMCTQVPKKRGWLPLTLLRRELHR
jgi:hypothetical protein